MRLPGGAAGAVSRITGALGKGIATLTMDDEYQKRRREALSRRPTGITEGFAQGGKGLVMVCLCKCLKLHLQGSDVILGFTLLRVHQC